MAAMGWRKGDLRFNPKIVLLLLCNKIILGRVICRDPAVTGEMQPGMSSLRSVQGDAVAALRWITMPPLWWIGVQLSIFPRVRLSSGTIGCQDDFMLMSGSFDLSLVALSVVIATAASYTALDLAARVRVSRGRVRLAWLILAAVTMGGGIWSMHFVAMLAFVMPTAVTYDLGLTVLSLFVAVAVTGVGFLAVSLGQVSWQGVAAGGLLMGAGICSMHYLGMAAMRMEAELTYDRLLVAVSFLIAAGASIVALRLSLASMSVTQQMGGAGAMGIAISGMHYTGMAGAAFHNARGDNCGDRNFGAAPE